MKNTNLNGISPQPEGYKGSLFRSPLPFFRKETVVSGVRTAVVPASPGAGASFVCGKLASEAKKPKAVVELGSSGFYLSLNLQKRFSGKLFSFYEELMQGCSVKDISNPYSGINWLVRKPGKQEPLSESALLRICSNAPEGNVFFDFSGLDEDRIFMLLPEMDRVILVIDPLPSKLIASASFIENLSLICPQREIIVNKMNKGVFRKELEKFLGKCEYTEIPFIDPSIVYKAEYNCILPQYFV